MRYCHVKTYFSQLVRVMVSPVNSPGATASCQKSMYQCGLLQQLCTILMATGVPADILTEVITEMLRKYHTKYHITLHISSSFLRRLGLFNARCIQLVMRPLSFRPSILYQRLSEAHRSTRTTLHLLMLPQTHQGSKQ